MTTGIESNHPIPETAYAAAPSIVREIGWVAEQAASRAFGEPMGREFWLRKAAVLDRIALQEEATYAPDVASEALSVAAKAAHRLAAFDWDHDTTAGPNAPSLTGWDVSYRLYVRQEYLTWSRKDS